MASQHPRKNYDDKTLDALEQALREVCEVIEAHEPLSDCDNVTEIDVRREVARRLMALVDTGVTDPAELRSRALKCFELKPH